MQNPVWLTKLKCDDENAQHILRCEHSAATSFERSRGVRCNSRDEVLLVSCGEDT